MHQSVVPLVVNSPTKMGRLFRLIAFILIGVISFVTVLNFLPGDNPLNDDWSYGEGVRNLLLTGQIYLPTVCAPGLPHVYLGSFVTGLLGFSYVNLRLAALVVSLFGVWVCYRSLILVNGDRITAFFLALLYFFNPIFLNVCCSFMSDTTGLALNSCFVYCALRAIMTGSRRKLIESSILLALATLVRQSAIVMGVIYLPAFFCRDWRSPELRPAVIGAALVPPALALWFDESWLNSRGLNGGLIADDYKMVRDMHHSFIQGLISEPVVHCLQANDALFMVLSYLGLFCLPLLPDLLSGLKNLFDRRDKGRIYLSATVLLLLYGAVHTIHLRGATMPYSENIWRVTSIGAQGIMGICQPPVTHGWRVFLSWSAGAAALLLALNLVGVACRDRKEAAVRFLVFGSLIFAAVETAVRSTDRYDLIVLLPLLLFVSAKLRGVDKRPRSVAWVLLILMAVYSLCGLEDYLAANGARYRLLSRLENSGVKYSDIDGGAEYNIKNNLRIYAGKFRGAAPRDKWRWWPIDKELYIVSFSPVPGYETIADAKYFSLLSMRKQAVLMLRQIQ